MRIPTSYSIKIPEYMLMMKIILAGLHQAYLFQVKNCSFAALKKNYSE